MSMKEVLTERYGAKGLTNKPEIEKDISIERVVANRANESRFSVRYHVALE